MTFSELCELEPKLKGLADEAKNTRDPGTGDAFCANAIWYGYFGRQGIKPRLLKLVGWERRIAGPAELRTEQAYDIAYDTIYNLLPSCRGQCGCM